MGIGRGSEFQLYLDCLNGLYQVPFQGIDLYEWASEHFKISVTILKYYIKFQDGEHKHKKGVIYSVRIPFIESVRHWECLLYEPASEPISIGIFSNLKGMTEFVIIFKSVILHRIKVTKPFETLQVS